MKPKGQEHEKDEDSDPENRTVGTQLECLGAFLQMCCRTAAERPELRMGGFCGSFCFLNL